MAKTRRAAHRFATAKSALGNRLTATLTTGAIAALCATTGLPTISQAADTSPIPVGLVLAKQGNFAELGEDGAHGAMLALKDAGGSVLGRPVKLIWADEASPQAAQQNMSRLIEEDKIVAVVGGTNSATALAISALAKRAKVPTIVVSAASQNLTGKECNRYTFRSQVTVPVAARALAPSLLLKGKRWYFVAANYAFGQEVYDAMKAPLLQAGGTEVGVDRPPLGTSDFSSFILKIRQANPDVIVSGVVGNDFNNLAKQYAQYGMQKRSLLAGPVIFDSAVWTLGADSATGLYGKNWYYADPQNPPEEVRMVKEWTAQYGRPPSDVAWEGWMSMRMLLLAIGQAKTTDGPAIVKALETIKVSGGALPAYYRSWDHQFIHQILVVEAGAPKRDKWERLTIEKRVPENVAGIDALYGTPEQIGCKMDEY
ncbi:MAG: ABC transporter substrate-binding protein [Janthinobacterium lividum]